ncbi:MAG: caspase family protein [Proteobacteria bacterium]|nr:caspase family protein [Pseudomonadota bacterium]MBU1596601.1 caspase family protein [Pseudomonadota bacterium]
MRVAGLLLATLCFVSLLAGVAHAERRVALVIGNGAYPTAPLKNPVNDARDMANALKSLGFEVIARENAGLRQMEDALDEFWKSLKRGGTGLFFFAGHGLQVKGVNYLVPVDARISVEQDVKSLCLDAGRVLGRMENAGNGLNIVLLDACRNNPFARSWRSADSGLAKMDAPTGTLIGYATAPDSVAADGSGRNGVYTQHLLREMRVPGQTIENAMKKVRIGVLNDTGRKQTPWESSSLTGDFYFNQQGAPAEPMAPMQAVPSKFDVKAEEKRLADEAARLKLEKEELAQMQAIQAKKGRLEAERLQVEQAKLLAMAPRPKQTPQVAPGASSNAHAAQFAQLARAGMPDARTYFERVVQGDPADVDARAGLVVALVFSGKDADARYQARRLSESNIQTANVRLARGLLLGLEGGQDAAYQFSRAADEGVDKALLALCQATVQLKRRQYDQVEASLRGYQSLVQESERGSYAGVLVGGLELKARLAGVYSVRWESGRFMGCGSNKFLVRFFLTDGVLGATHSGQFNCDKNVVGVSGVRLNGATLHFVIETPGLFAQCNFKMTADISRGMDEAPGTWEACVVGTDPITLVREPDQNRLSPQGKE